MTNLCKRGDSHLVLNHTTVSDIHRDCQLHTSGVAGQKFFAGYDYHPQHFKQLGNTLHKTSTCFCPTSRHLSQVRPYSQQL